MIYKCKKSVFCICFLIFFFLGTISGVFMFCCLLRSTEGHLFCALDFPGVVSEGVVSVLFSVLRPLSLVALFAFHPRGYAAVFPMIVIRGFLISYCFSAVWFSETAFWPFILKELVVLPLFYCLCRWVYFRWDRSCRC